MVFFIINLCVFIWPPGVYICTTRGRRNASAQHSSIRWSVAALRTPPKPAHRRRRKRVATSPTDGRSVTLPPFPPNRTVPSTWISDPYPSRLPNRIITYPPHLIAAFRYRNIRPKDSGEEMGKFCPPHRQQYYEYPK